MVTAIPLAASQAAGPLPLQVGTHLPIAPMLVALLTAVATLLLGRSPREQVATSLAGGTVYAATVALLAWRVVFAEDGGALAYQLGDWPAPFGITLVADGLAAFMLAMAAVVGLAALVFSVRYVAWVDQQVFYHPLFHFMLLGISGAFLTGDLFNLFVWFEVMLLASYVFVVFYGGGEHTRAALRYVVLNVVGSAVMLVAIGGLYATTGTLNMADMSRRLADPAAFGVQVEPVVGLSALLLSVFALKAGLVPFQFWVPDAYRAAPLPVTALLAAGTKKVGIYALVRIYFTVLGGASVPISFPALAGETPLGFFGPVLFAMAVASIFVGGLGAVDAESIEGVFAYSSVGQIGFIAVPVAVGATASSPTLRHLGVLAGLVYALNHALAKGTLFLVAAAVRSAAGTSRFVDLGGVADRSPVASGACLVGALALVGIPPLSGFVGKLLVFDVVVRDGAVLALGALLAGTLLTIAYTTRAWNRGFWGSTSPAVETATVDPVQAAVLVALAGTVLAVGVGFEPVYRFADAAATAALDRGTYVELVAPRGGGGA
jgi:multicomponent Na+:H+ antiporter subunit D